MATKLSPAGRRARAHLRAVAHAQHPGHVMVEGVRLVAEAISRGAPLSLLLGSPRLWSRPGLEPALAAIKGHPRLEELPDRELAALGGGPSSQGVIAVVRLPSAAPDDCLGGRGPLVCLDGVQDAHNFGAIARAALAFGASGLWYRRGGARPDSARAYRAAAGALLQLPVASVDDLEASLRRSGLPVVVADHHGAALEPGWPAALPAALVFGSEGRGSALGVGNRLRIPMQPESESLNVAQAAAILLQRCHARLGPHAGGAHADGTL